MPSTAPTVVDDGAEECFWSKCKNLTTKRFQCSGGHRVWMCSSCYRDRPVCSLCSAEEREYKTDTDLDSRPDSSVSLEESPLVELHGKVATGEYEETLNAMAGITLGDKKRDALRDARKATRTSEELLPTKLLSEQLLKEIKRLNVPGLKGISYVYSQCEVIELDFDYIPKTEFGPPAFS